EELVSNRRALGSAVYGYRPVLPGDYRVACYRWFVFAIPHLAQQLGFGNAALVIGLFDPSIHGLSHARKLFAIFWIACHVGKFIGVLIDNKKFLRGSGGFEPLLLNSIEFPLVSI